MFLFVLTVYKILLSKISGQEDITVGTSMAARSHRDLETVIGIFVNTVMLRSQPVPEKTFRSYLGDVMRVNFEAFENQDFPFNELVTRLGGGRKNSRNPLFNVFFEFEEEDLLVTLPGVSLESYPFRPSLRAKFDLGLRIQEVRSELVFAWAYPINLYDEYVIPEMHDCLVHIIRQACRSAETKLLDFNFPGDEPIANDTTPNLRETENDPFLDINFNLSDL